MKVDNIVYAIKKNDGYYYGGYMIKSCKLWVMKSYAVHRCLKLNMIGNKNGITWKVVEIELREI